MTASHKHIKYESVTSSWCFRSRTQFTNDSFMPITVIVIPKCIAKKLVARLKPYY